jgi:signal transduction histidine kinase
VPAHSSAAYVREAGLAAALERHIADLARDGLQVAIDTAGYLPQHQDHEAALYRIAQEALANVAKHAETTRAELRLWTIDDRTLLRIKDHGRGFQRPSDSASTDPHSSPHGTFGLRSMRERAQALGGTLRIDAAPGQGTTIEASIPRNDR